MICRNCGSPVDERVGVCPFCGVVQKDAVRWKQRYFVTPDRCCVCGQSLVEGYKVLFAYESGDQARIDLGCAEALEALRRRTDPKAVTDALHRFGEQLETHALDPAVDAQLRPLAEEAGAWLAEVPAVPASPASPPPPSAAVPAEAAPAATGSPDRPAGLHAASAPRDLFAVPPIEPDPPRKHTAAIALIALAMLAGLALLGYGLYKLLTPGDPAPAAASPKAEENVEWYEPDSQISPEQHIVDVDFGQSPPPASPPSATPRFPLEPDEPGEGGYGRLRVPGRRISLTL